MRALGLLAGLWCIGPVGPQAGLHWQAPSSLPASQMTAIAANDDCSEESDNTTVAIISQRPTRLRFLTDGVAFLSISMLPKYERFKFGEAMTAITLEGDSGHRPPF